MLCLLSQGLDLRPPSQSLASCQTAPPGGAGIISGPGLLEGVRSGCVFVLESPARQLLRGSCRTVLKLMRARAAAESEVAQGLWTMKVVAFFAPRAATAVFVEVGPGDSNGLRCSGACRSVEGDCSVRGGWLGLEIEVLSAAEWDGGPSRGLRFLEATLSRGNWRLLSDLYRTTATSAATDAPRCIASGGMGRAATALRAATLTAVGLVFATSRVLGAAPWVEARASSLGRTQAG